MLVISRLGFSRGVFLPGLGRNFPSPCHAARRTFRHSPALCDRHRCRSDNKLPRFRMMNGFTKQKHYPCPWQSETPAGGGAPAACATAARPCAAAADRRVTPPPNPIPRGLASPLPFAAFPPLRRSSVGNTPQGPEGETDPRSGVRHHFWQCSRARRGSKPFALFVWLRLG